MFLELTSHGELHYLWSVDLSKSFSELIKTARVKYFLYLVLFDGVFDFSP